MPEGCQVEFGGRVAEIATFKLNGSVLALQKKGMLERPFLLHCSIVSLPPFFYLSYFSH
jgi:hypothetical protein